MSESLYQKQKDVRPKINDVIGEVLCDDALKNAFDFLSYLKESKLNPQWASANSWKVSYKAFTVCYIRLKDGTLQVQPLIGEHEEDFLPQGLKEIVWANKKPWCCGACSVRLTKVFGKEYDRVCESSFIFINPDVKAFECIKKLVELRKNAIKERKAKRHTYVAMNNR